MILKVLASIFLIMFLIIAIVSFAILVGAFVFVRTGGQIELNYEEDDNEDQMCM